jgi:hypothetical protein
MNCAARNKEVKKNNDYNKGIQDSTYTLLVIVAYVFCRYGYKGRRIQQMINSIQDVADSINKGYCTQQDLEGVLLDEYDIQLFDTSSEV